MDNEETIKKGPYICCSHHIQRSKETMEKQTESKSDENSKVSWKNNEIMNDNHKNSGKGR
ncbi:hypothetical protein EI200_07465 [Peribacillus simplex]|uniref:hypothetical protein n=1 Tax=Peribacillus simplex TaxID=1478 RepID=UPI000F634DD7|nr:hypothetical protein [Peribacillus simplex]RRN72417.1 hypothetical protein EI200_07465 [Peribacillus simplex]